jgi:hypothetical protein
MDSEKKATQADGTGKHTRAECTDEAKERATKYEDRDDEPERDIQRGRIGRMAGRKRRAGLGNEMESDRGTAASHEALGSRGGARRIASENRKGGSRWSGIGDIPE